MGIRGLSTFLDRNRCGMSDIHLSNMRGSTVAVDFSNVLYRFLYRDAKTYLMEFINFIHKFQRYGINLIFVFDGRPTAEKEYELSHRRAYREKINKKIDELSNDSNGKDNTEIIKHLEKKTHRIENSYLFECKQLFNILGIPYICVDNLEADAVFTYLLKNHYADACFSADTDLLAYGCHTILRELDYRNDTVECINYDNLINELGISSEQFLHTCILSGTTYNNSMKHSNFANNLLLIQKYETIQNIIDNLEIINSTELPEHQKSIPLRFDWETAHKIFTVDILDDAKSLIDNELEHFDEFHYFNKETLLQYLDNIIKQNDTTKKYSKKFIDIVLWKFKFYIKLCS